MADRQLQFALHNEGLVRMRRTILLAMSASMLSTASTAQPCNPMIDGTYCAEVPIRRADNSQRSTGRFNSLPPMHGVGSIGGSQFGADPPATFGAAVFRAGGERCIGLLRRSSCN